MNASDPPDLNHVRTVLEYLATTEPEVVDFARLLLDDGGRVLEAWGPQQMAVWRLVVQRGAWQVRFHSERGYAEGASIARSTNPPPRFDDHRSIGLAIFAWARANGVPFRLAEPDNFDHGLVAHGRDALDWLNQGHDEDLERVFRAWYAYRSALGRRDGEALRALKVGSVRAMEDAAAG